MANIKLSATRIDTFLSCKQKYWYNYVDKLPKVGNTSFKVGLAVHESLELAGNIWKEKEKFTKKDKELIFKKYDEVSVSEGLDNYEIHAEGRELVEKRLANFLVGEKVIGLEYKFGFWGKDAGPQIKSDSGVPLMGSIDKAEQYDEDTILIIDYKTSKTAPTASQMKSNIQLSLYDIAARKLFPQYKRVILALDLLKSGILFTYRTDKQRKEFDEYLRAVYDAMVNLKAEDVKASLNTFCPWCDYKDYCSTYKKACSKSNYNFLPTMNMSDEELINEWEQVKAVAGILKQRKSELDMVMIEKIKKSFGNLKAEDKEIYIRQNSSTDFDLKTLYNTVPSDDFVSLVNVNKKAVKQYIDLNPSVRNTILDSSTTNVTSAFLSSRKIKK